MRHDLPMSLVLISLAACSTTPVETSPFLAPNDLMGQEIENRIEQIPYLHREQLYDNMIWLSKLGEQAIGSLLGGLQHSTPKVRSSCAWILGRIGDRRTISYLQAMADDENEVVRLETARSLVLMGDVTRSPILIEGLDSPKVQVRYLCHEALKEVAARDFGYDHLSEDPQARRKAVLGWRRWWSQQTADPWFASQYAQENGLTDLILPDVAPLTAPPAAPGMETRRPVGTESEASGMTATDTGEFRGMESKAGGAPQGHPKARTDHPAPIGPSMRGSGS